MTNLCDYSDLYNLQAYNFNGGQLQQHLEQLGLNRAYSDILKATIWNLCSMNDEKRVRFSELNDWVAPHEKSILER